MKRHKHLSPERMDISPVRLSFCHYSTTGHAGDIWCNGANARKTGSQKALLRAGDELWMRDTSATASSGTSGEAQLRQYSVASIGIQGRVWSESHLVPPGLDRAVGHSLLDLAANTWNGFDPRSLLPLSPIYGNGTGQQRGRAHRNSDRHEGPHERLLPDDGRERLQPPRNPHNSLPTKF